MSLEVTIAPGKNQEMVQTVSFLMGLLSKMLDTIAARKL